MKSPIVALLCAALCLAAPACSKPASQEAAPLSNVQFQGTETIPERVENLKGTALLGMESDFSKLGGGGSYFVLLSPTDPLKGVIVHADLSPDELKKLESKQLNVSGNVRTLEDTSMVTHFQQSYNLTLKTAADGKPQVIEHEGALDLPQAGSPTPGGGTIDPAQLQPGTPTPTGSTPSGPQ